MAVVFIPTLMQKLTDGESTVTVPGSTVRQIVNNLEQEYPGIKDRLVDGHKIKPNISGCRRRSGHADRHAREGERRQRGPLPAGDRRRGLSGLGPLPLCLRERVHRSA